MPFPTAIDAQIRKRFSDLIVEAGTIAANIQAANAQYMSKADIWLGDRNRRGPGPKANPIDETAFYSLRTKTLSLLEMLSLGGGHIQQVIAEVQAMRSTDYIQHLHGIITGLKNDYDSGMLERISSLIEANVTADYMGQAEQLLGEGIPGQYDHVPAAVLAGAVLEDALRRLCQRQPAPIVLTNPNGSPKTLDPLIADLQRANVFTKSKADTLRSWAKTRNDAAHGNFGGFNRMDVEAMITGIKTFLGDYL